MLIHHKIICLVFFSFFFGSNPQKSPLVDVCQCDSVPPFSQPQLCTPLSVLVSHLHDNKVPVCDSDPEATSRTNAMLFFTCRVWELQVLPADPQWQQGWTQGNALPGGERPWCSCWSAWHCTVWSQKLSSSSSSLYHHGSVSTSSWICTCPVMILLGFFFVVVL